MHGHPLGARQLLPPFRDSGLLGLSNSPQPSKRAAGELPSDWL